MRDLRSRLREIVRRESAAPPGPHPRSAQHLDVVAAGLGGAVAGREGSEHIVIDRTWPGHARHGAHDIASCAVAQTAPIGLFDARLGNQPDWARHVVFFDIETTGLSGGAGTLAFLAGCGWFDEGGFRVRQFFLAGPAGERSALDALADVFRAASLVVTFNGRTFDLPVMDMRWAFHRTPSPTETLAHLDMLPPARRLWGRRTSAGRTARTFAAPDPDTNCSLLTLERSILGFHRAWDVPGFEIPSRYFEFLRTGETTPVEGVLEHNQHDLVSLAAITAHALRLAADGPEACRDAGERLALGRLYQRAGETARAAHAYELAAGAGDPDVRAHALARLALLLRRDDRYDEAAEAWRGVLDLEDGLGQEPSAWGRRAAEALAIHHEHRARDLEAARRYAETLRASVEGRPADEALAEHRLRRLDRKLGLAQDTKGGPAAAPLLHDD